MRKTAFLREFLSYKRKKKKSEPNNKKRELPKKISVML